MRSRSERRRGVRACPRVPTCKRAPGRWRVSACVAAALTLLLAQSALAASTPEASPSDAQIEAAVSTLKDDPNLFSKRKIRTLHWASHADRPADSNPATGWLDGSTSCSRGSTESGRVLVWAVLRRARGDPGRLSHRALRERRDERVAAGLCRADSRAGPGHPARVAARRHRRRSRDLWERGEHRAALALLYRGMPVAARARPRRARFAIRPPKATVWRLPRGICALTRPPTRPSSCAPGSEPSIAAKTPTAEVVTPLCDGFGAALDAPPAGQPAELAA